MLVSTYMFFIQIKQSISPVFVHSCFVLMFSFVCCHSLRDKQAEGNLQCVFPQGVKPV